MIKAQTTIYKILHWKLNVDQHQPQYNQWRTQLFRIRKKKSVITNTGNCFCFNSNVSNLYNNDVIIYKIQKSRDNSFVCERVYIFFSIRRLVKFLSSFIKITAKTSACISGLQLILEIVFTIALLGYYCTNICHIDWY
jgi:hypothetical protein